MINLEVEKIEIKEINSSELEELKQISIETFGDTFGSFNTIKDLEKHYSNAYNIAQLGKEIKNSNSFFYFVKNKGTNVAYLKLNINDAQTEDMGSETLEIERIYVRKRFKRLGIGSQLMEKAVRLAKENGKNKIWLGVWEKNEAARIFYQKQGFKQVGDHIFNLGQDKQRDLIMIKDI